MAESVLSAHAPLRFEEAEALVLQWFDELGLDLGHAEHDRLIGWFDEAFTVPDLAELAVEVQFYGLADGWSQLRWRIHHGSGERVSLLGGEILEMLVRLLQADSRWSIDLCRKQPEISP